MGAQPPVYVEKKEIIVKQSTRNRDLEAAFGDIDLLGITEGELDQQCDELFADEPITFVPRKGNAIDLRIKFYIVEYRLLIPIVHIKDRLYLIGCNRMTCELTRDQLMVRVGGGYERFEEYVPGHARYFMRMLVVHMIKSGESLEWVIEQLISGKKIKNIHLEAQNKAIRQAKL